MDQPEYAAPDDPRKTESRDFPCESCGADLAFHIGSQALRCRYCGFTKQISLDEDAEISEQDLVSALEAQVAQREDEASPDAAEREVHCPSCGATLLFRHDLTTQDCVYCGSPIHAEATGAAERRIPVDAVLPFGISAQRARQAAGDWLRGLWFAPSDFLRSDVPDRLRGVYLPYWTFDAMTFTRYSGERGTREQQTRRVNGKTEQHSTLRWRSVSGRFQRLFDDRPVAADSALPRTLLQRLEPWPFHACVPYTPDVLAGYVAKAYDVPLDEGFKIARERIEDELRSQAQREIGGDAQRVHQLSTRWDALTYKHLLLPVWLLVLRYRGRPYQLIVNAATGEVTGDRPWSRLKLGLAGGLVCAAIALAVGWQQGWL